MGAGGLGLPSRPGSSKAPALNTEVIFANPFTWSFVTQLFKIVAFRVTLILSTVGMSPCDLCSPAGSAWQTPACFGCGPLSCLLHYASYAHGLFQ